MKYVFVLCIIAFSLIGCDGRKDSKTVLEDSLSEMRQKYQTKHEILFPQEHLKNVTDTIYSNGFQIRISNYTLNDKNILVSNTLEKERNTRIIKYYRVSESEITVCKDSKLLFVKHFNSDNFKYKTDSEFWNNATLEHVWVNDDIYNFEQMNINFSFINPIDNTYKMYRMHIDEKGIENTYLIEDHS